MGTQRTISLAASLATDCCKVTCFRTTSNTSSTGMLTLGLTTVEITYYGAAWNDITVSSGGGRFCAWKGWLNGSNVRTQTGFEGTT